MRLATQNEVEHWDEIVATCGLTASVLQGRAFAQIKSTTGWHPGFYLTDGGLPLLVLKRTVRSFGELNYLPGGPMAGSLEELAVLLPELRQLPGFLTQLEPELSADPAELSALIQAAGLRRRGGIQPNTSTVVIDLSPDEPVILEAFHSKTRYNVRLAERRGVTVAPVQLTAESMGEMYRLMSSSQERGGYYLRPRSYFEAAWQTYAKNQSGQLFFAHFEGQILAGAFITFIGQKALYKDGGSTREHREVQPMSLLQWEVMRWLKAHGVERYDLHGVPPEDRLEDPTHPLAGLARFKTGFQPVTTTYIGVLELPISLTKYRLWQRLGERVYGAALYRLRGQSIY